MNTIRMVECTLQLAFEAVGEKLVEFNRDYARLGESEFDAIGQWLRTAKAKGDAGESDPVLLNLMVELYRKMDRLEKMITMALPDALPLLNSGVIHRIGFEYFEVETPCFEIGQMYYGRVVLPSLSSKETGLFFEADSATLAHITQIRPQDENEWGAYMRARERIMIREMKGTMA